MANNVTASIVEIFWNYAPTDFFEERITFTQENCLFEIEGGQAIAKVEGSFYESQADLEKSLKEEVRTFFLGAQPYRRILFEFTGGGTNWIYPDGHRRISGWEPLTLIVVSPEDNQIYRDDNGIEHDPRRERIDSMKNLGQLSAYYAPLDPSVHRMLESFDASIRYPENELVYLYEIWDALQTKFRSGNKARRALGLLKPDSSRLTRLANKEPLNQGRHRGQFAEGLRDATSAELGEARKIAKEMVEKYLRYFDGKQKAK